MSDLGRISGPMLKSNLERLGVDLVFENQFGDNNLYLDVNSKRIGVNTDVPSKELLVSGDAYISQNIIVDNDSQLVNLYFDSDTGVITSTGNGVTIFNGGQLFAPGLSTPSIEINDNTILGLNSNEDIIISPSGTGSLRIFSDANIAGDLNGVNDLNITGNITVGNDPAVDTLVVNPLVFGNFIPTASDTYDIGSEEFKWGGVRSRLINGLYLQTTDVSLVPDLNPNVALPPGASWYVGTNGSDTDLGYHQLAPFATIKKALSEASSGETVFIYPGTYIEEFPLEVPAGVTVKGFDIRTVIIEPTEATQDLDCFLLHSDTNISDLTIRNYYYNSTNDTGYGFRFASNYEFETRSPYIQNVTVITSETTGSLAPVNITIGPDITLFSQTSNSVNLDKTYWSQELVDSLVGQIAVIDVYPDPPLYYTVVSIETDPIMPTQWRMTVDTAFDSAGQIKPIRFYPDVELTQIVTNDIWDTTGNSVGEKWVAW